MTVTWLPVVPVALICQVTGVTASHPCDIDVLIRSEITSTKKETLTAA